MTNIVLIEADFTKEKIQFQSKVFGTNRDNSDDGVDELSDAKDELGFEAVWVERIAPLVHAQLHHHPWSLTCSDGFGNQA